MFLRRVAVFLVMIFPVLAVAQRLPGNVVPEHYALTFTPDLQKATFIGQEMIDVRVAQAGSSVTLNAADLEFQQVNITQNGATMTASVSTDPAKEQATLTLPAPLGVGAASIEIRFTGTLNDQLRGFYLAKTKLRNYGVTQFEATDARRAFPSFDEPAYKATFDITLIVNRGDTAVSNGRIVSDTPGPAEDQHTLKFSTTKKMSTYLVAMAVGDLQCNEGESDGIPIRVCGTPDKKALSSVALQYAEEILKFYNQYYGIRYPFEKLDIVGAPDFEAGAMENTAAIFYRESLLFIDDKNSSVGSHQEVFEVLAHEMAHQWFGDLVTMKWWDNLWLNEGFATWMALKPSQALHPEWNATLDAVKATDGALSTDSFKNTHPIRAQADTPDQINQLFDSISYEKAAAVLRMVEAYVSPEVFRRGVNTYLRRFSYNNASAADFWNTLTAASGRPVDRIMPTFVNQPGEPLVKVTTSCVTPPPIADRSSRRRGRRARKPLQPHPRTEVTASQKRFFLDPDAAPPGNELWMIPVCVKAADNKPFCQILGERQQTLPLSGCTQWAFVNSNAVGYYRTQYDSEMLKKLSAVAMEQLSTAERMSLVSDLGALMRSGQEKVGSFLDWVAALNQDQERAVVESYSGYLESIDHYLVTPADRDAYHAWLRSTFRPIMAKVGWTPTAGEKDDTRELRGDLISILGEIAQDPETVQEASRLARQYLKDPESLDASITSVVLRIAAEAGDSNLFDEYVTAARNAHTPEQYYYIERALTKFSEPQLIERVLQISVSPEVRNQDAPGLIAASLGATKSQSIAWEWIKAHWPDVEKKLTAQNGAAIVYAARSFCTADAREDVQHFFSEHKVASSDRALRQSVERINSCISYRERQQGNLAAWLGQHAATANAGNP